MKLDYSFAQTSASKLSQVFASENISVFVLSFAALFLPIIFGHANSFPNQIIVGTTVNALLALSALYLPLKKALPIILLPALAALISGFIFGSLTSFLFYMVPFIWLGNFAFVFLIKNLKVLNGMNYGASVFFASSIKSGIIFSATLAFVLLGVVPALFLFPMGLVQFATALGGGGIAGAALLLKK